ncbi:MAG: NTP transferase domain-containing protein, partial [Sphingomonadales bacterium]
MSKGNLGIIILAAGKGERMKSRTPKALQPLGGMPMLGHVLAVARGLKPVKIVVVTGPSQVESYLQGQFPGVAIAIQDPPQGTGDAVRCAGSHFDGFDGDILILYGDVPLTSPATLKALVEGHKEAAVGLIGMEAATPGNYGR